jgi:hypothetical protein
MMHNATELKLKARAAAAEILGWGWRVAVCRACAGRARELGRVFPAAYAIEGRLLLQFLEMCPVYLQDVHKKSCWPWA